MKILYSLEQFSDSRTPIVLAAGCFDGLHIGHAAVIGAALERARAVGGQTWVLTFEPHPAKILTPDQAPPLIFVVSQRLCHLMEMGVEGCILQPFTPAFMQQDPFNFFDLLCACIPALSGICVGEDWSFGRCRMGGIELLAKLCAKRSITFSAHPSILWKGARVSSTRIREAVKWGRMEKAAHMLGRPFSTVGTVEHGFKIGRRLGFPTANIAPENELFPPCGVYAARLRVGKTDYHAAAYIGRSATFRTDDRQVLEVYLLGESAIDLYGRKVEVSYLKYVRGDSVFQDADTLKRQIAADVSAVRSILNTQ